MAFISPMVSLIEHIGYSRQVYLTLSAFSTSSILFLRNVYLALQTNEIDIT